MPYGLAEELIIRTDDVALVSWIFERLAVASLLLPFLAVGWALGLAHRTEVIELLTFNTFFPYAGQFLPSSCVPVCPQYPATLHVLGWMPLLKLSSKLLHILRNFHVAYLK